MRAVAPLSRQHGAVRTRSRQKYVLLLSPRPKKSAIRTPGADFFAFVQEVCTVVQMADRSVQCLVAASSPLVGGPARDFLDHGLSWWREAKVGRHRGDQSGRPQGGVNVRKRGQIHAPIRRPPPFLGAVGVSPGTGGGCRGSTAWDVSGKRGAQGGGVGRGGWELGRREWEKAAGRDRQGQEKRRRWSHSLKRASRATPVTPAR